MMSFCKNTLHAFLGISNRDILQFQSPPTAGGLNSITGDNRKPSNIIESTSLKSFLGKDSSGSSSPPLFRDGLSSCTESLGFESSEQMEETTTINDTTTSITTRRRKLRVREEAKKFPPPLSSLRRNQGDSSTSFLKPVRENGRLILTEVTINRPEIFRASRENGRLRLQLVQHRNSESNEVRHEENEGKKNMVTTTAGGGVTGVRGETLWWCHEQEQKHRHRHRHHPHRQQLWNQQCVTSR